jgi:hypothetical protein
MSRVCTAQGWHASSSMLVARHPHRSRGEGVKLDVKPLSHPWVPQQLLSPWVPPVVWPHVADVAVVVAVAVVVVVAVVCFVVVVAAAAVVVAAIISTCQHPSLFVPSLTSPDQS